VNREPPTLVELKDNDFEQVTRPIGTEMQRAARLIVSFLERIAHERVLDRVKNVIVGDAVLAPCGMDLHTALV
jgi:hypothetical protein